MGKKAELIDVTRGLLHVPDPRDVPPGHQLLPDCLLVFVHGFASGPEAWKNEPRRILNDLAVECAYFQYRYPSKFWEAADVESAAADLRSYLDGNLGKFAHIVFFTHSTGALVVQELLRSSFTPALPIEEPAGRVQRLGSLLSRTRSVINLAGAHHGAQPFARSLKWLYNIGWAPVSFVLKRIPVIGKRFGDFKLRNQIQPIQDNDFLRKLTEQYRIVLENQAALGEPCPVSFDYTARIEGVVQQEQDNPARRRNVLSIGYAWHFLSSLLTVAGSTLPARVFPQTMRNAISQTGAASALRWDLAYDSLRFIALIDSEQGVEGLLTDEMNTKSSSRTQKTLFDDIRATLAGNEARILVLSGPGGTGKSVLMRQAARALAVDWLSHENASGFRLPFTINMKRLEIPNDVVQRYVSNGRQPKDLWDAIKEAWKPVGHALRADRPVGEILIDAKGSNRRPEIILSDSDRPQVTSDWMDECWRGGDTVLFLDSVDEFLNSYRFLGAGDFIGLLYYLSGSDNVHRKIVFAIREGEREAIGQIALPCAWFRLDRLSDDSTLDFLERHARPANTNGTNGAVDHRRQQLNEIFRALPAAARETIATPLVFYKLPSLLDIEEPSKLSTVSGVLELALRKTIEDEPLGRPVLPSEQHTSWQMARPDERLDMLSVLGWIYACDDEGPYRARPLTWLISMLAEQKAVWDDQDPPEAAQRITKAFNNLMAEGGLQACLRRSIARFLSLCILSGVFKPLTERTYHPSIFLRIADYLSVPPLPGFPTSIRRSTIDKMLAWLSRDPRDGQFVIGNFAAIMSHGNFAIDADALAAIMSNLDRIPALAKHVVLSGFGYRALAENPRDPTAGILKTQIIPAAAEHISRVNPATASLVWSLIRALDPAAVEKLGSWPNPDNADAEAIFRMVCPGFPDNDDLAQRISLQNGYVQTTMSMLEDEHRTIASMHYLLFAVMTLHRNAAVADTITELSKILIDMKDLFTARLQAYERCPEMLELYKFAQTVFREKTGRG